MSLAGKYTPLNLNSIGSFIHNEGLAMNAKAVAYIGTVDSSDLYTPGSLVKDTILARTHEIYAKAFELAYPTHAMGSLVALHSYIIKSIGTTDFTSIGATSNTIGTRFIATGHGEGTGTAVSASGDGTLSVQLYEALTTMGADSVPLLANNKPTSYTRDYIATSARYGFLGQYPTQAFNEYYINNGSYTDFFNVFSTCMSFKNQSNKVIQSFAYADKFLDGIYSNMNDLITGDIAGVNLSTFFWGQDLINSGRAIDLSKIDTFGNPDDLLRTLSKNRAVTRAVNLALLAGGMTSADITNILNGTKATTEQNKTLYGCFNLVMGTDLADVLVPINCQTKGLVTLADLLDPKMLFPNSYQSLTFPQYNGISNLPTNSKTYYLLYRDGEVNKVPSLPYGDRLRNIMPDSIAYSADAFSATMMQVKNIKAMNIEKFSQAVTNLENVNGLGVNGTNVPANTVVAQRALDTLGQGSGKDGKYTTADFFGSMSDILYPWPQLQDAITLAESFNGIDALRAKFQEISNVLDSGVFSGLDTIIGETNNVLTMIHDTNLAQVKEINNTYGLFGLRLAQEQNARALALPNGTKDLVTTVSDVYGFIDNLGIYASETAQYESAALLESICDLNHIGGTSLIASMREIRNAKRLGLVGGELDNDVDIPALNLSIANGSKAVLTTVDLAGNVGTANVSVVTGAGVPGSFGGSPDTTLIPDNLNVLNIATGPTVLVPDQAIADVIRCNCDCWDLLN